MKVLVYGAGVIGSYLAHVLCEAGNDVTMLARSIRKAELEQKGLVIRHYLQKKITADHPRIVDKLGEEAYDIIFAAMQYQQMRSVLDDLADSRSPLVVLVGNNLSAPEMDTYIKEHAAFPKTVVFGFQATGGRRENGEMICVRKGVGTLHLGLVHSLPDEGTRSALQNAFGSTEYRLAFQPDMDGWYKSHLAFILPVAYLCYILECDLKRAGLVQLKQCVDAAGEGFGLLRAINIPILPEGEDTYFNQGLKRALMTAMLWIAAKTALGRLAASDHCRNAADEMRALDMGFEAIRKSRPDLSMARWDTLRSAMPDWDAVALQYGKEGKHA